MSAEKVVAPKQELHYMTRAFELFWLIHMFSCSVTCDRLYEQKTAGPKKPRKEAFYSKASCYRADARNTSARGSYHAWFWKCFNIAMQWHCRWTRCCYRAHWHGMVVYEWWCDVDCHFWTLCKLLCCNADGWNMQTYFQYLDKEATAIGIGKVDESAKLASRTRVKPLLAVPEERWNRCNSQHLSSFTWHRIAHQINDNFRVLRTHHGADLLAAQGKERNASFGRRPLSIATEHEHANSEHYYRACIIEYFL